MTICPIGILLISAILFQLLSVFLNTEIISHMKIVDSFYYVFLDSSVGKPLLAVEIAILTCVEERNELTFQRKMGSQSRGKSGDTVDRNIFREFFPINR
jgi:hypothetical protein